jgi:hypothetical protein
VRAGLAGGLRGRLGEAVAITTLACVANLATYAWRPMRRLRMEQFISPCGGGRSQREVGAAQAGVTACCVFATLGAIRLHLCNEK